MQVSRKIGAWLPTLLLILLPLGIYWHSLGNGFVVWDDDTLVYKNPLVQHMSLYSIWAVFTSYDPELYIPLTFLSYQIEHALFGLHASVFHATNLLLHIISTVFVYFLLQRWKLSRWVAFGAAALFALHPMNSEGVCWISARKDMLSNTLFLGTLLAWQQYRLQGLQRRYWQAVMLFGFALLAKVSVVLLPIVFLLIDWRDRRPIHRKSIQELAPFIGLSVMFILIALFGKTTNIASLTPWQTTLLATKAVVFYPMTYLLPFSLSSIYHQSTPITLASPEFALPALCALCVAGFSLLSLRWSRIPLFCVLFFLVMLAPSFANFSKMGSLYFASDRYISIAQISLLYGLGIAWTVLARIHRQSASIATLLLALAVMPAFVAASYQRSILWGDSETLFRDAMAKNPGSAVIHFNLAVVEQERGHYSEALALYDKALAIRPDFSQAYNNAGLIYKEQGDATKAEQWFLKAEELDPHNLSALINLASVQLDRGNADAAISLLQRALMEDPYNVPALSKLGAAYGKKEMYAEGLHAFQRAWKLDPIMHAQSKELEQMLLHYNVE
jgi:tetratricopeptide (TPR) repeat protein